MAEVSEVDSPKKRGRPKGSPNKRTLLRQAAPVFDTPKRARGRPRSKPPKPEGPPGKRGRPKGSRNKVPKPVGRPRKHPLPSADELKKPKVWKPLGRPRKHPRTDDPEGSGGTPQPKGPKKNKKRGQYPKIGPLRKKGRPKKGEVAEEPENAEEKDASE